MATPLKNSVPTTAVSGAGTGDGRFLIDGSKWGGALGTGVALTYSFPTGSAYSRSGYGSSEFSTWSTLSSGERAAFTSALGVWSAVANVSFSAVKETSTTVGEIRVAFSDAVGANSSAYAYSPSNYVEAGDIWLNPDHFNAANASTVAKGSFDFLTLMHEIGHALGLQHSFDSVEPLPQGRENFFWTVMSYTAASFVPQGNNYASFYPTTPMYYDLAAIQALYGRNTAHNAGNTTYTFVDGKQYFETIDDASGTDTIVYRGADAVTIDLRIAQSSSVSEAIRFSNNTSSRDTVIIGPNTWIENAKGGSAGDKLVGNSRANTLTGNGGSDSLHGGRGNDRLLGGDGNDRLYGGDGADILTGGAGADRFYFRELPGTLGGDTITDFDPLRDSLYLDDGDFTLLDIGRLPLSSLLTGSASADVNNALTYDRARGTLSYDEDGVGGKAAVTFLKLAAGTTLGPDNIIVF